MGIEADLKTYLSAQPTVASLVGARVHRGYAPQGSVDPKNTSWAPYIVLQRITGGHEHQTTGALGIAQPVIQVSCVAPSYGQAREVAEAVRGVLHGYSGTMSNTTVRGATLDNEIDLVEEPENAAERPVHQVVADYRIWVLESIPSL